MEKLLQNIVRRFIKQIDTSRIQLKEVESGGADNLYSSFDDEENIIYHVYKIKYNHLTIGTVVTVINKARGIKYLSNIDIIAPFRSFGIGTYVLKHWFSGYYIMADNTRAGQLYARLGKRYNKFTRKEFEEFIQLLGMKGVYKLDALPDSSKIDFKQIRLIPRAKGILKHPEGFVYGKLIIYDIVLEGVKIGHIEKEAYMDGSSLTEGFYLNPEYRNKGIGSYILGLKEFRGSFIAPGNNRVRSLYKRLSEKSWKNFSESEKEQWREMYRKYHGMFKLR